MQTALFAEQYCCLCCCKRTYTFGSQVNGIKRGLRWDDRPWRTRSGLCNIDYDGRARSMLIYQFNDPPVRSGKFHQLHELPSWLVPFAYQDIILDMKERFPYLQVTHQRGRFLLQLAATSITRPLSLAIGCHLYYKTFFNPHGPSSQSTSKPTHALFQYMPKSMLQCTQPVMAERSVMPNTSNLVACL